MKEDSKVEVRLVNTDQDFVESETRLIKYLERQCNYYQVPFPNLLLSERKVLTLENQELIQCCKSLLTASKNTNYRPQPGGAVGGATHTTNQPSASQSYRHSHLPPHPWREPRNDKPYPNRPPVRDYVPNPLNLGTSASPTRPSAPVIKAFGCSPPLSVGTVVRCAPEDKNVQEIRENFRDLSRGLPVRCIGNDATEDQKNSLAQVVRIQKQMLDKDDVSTMETNRPVTHLFEGCKTMLYRDDGVIFCFKPEQLTSTAIFPKNVLSNEFKGKSQDEVEAMADDEVRRGSRRFASVSALGRAMKERESHFATLDKTPCRPPYFSVNAHKDSWSGWVKNWLPLADQINPGWTKPEQITAQYLLKDSMKSHNEHVVLDITPYAISSCLHYLAPIDFKKDHSIYWYLGARIEAIQTIKPMLHNLTHNPMLPMVVYDPSRGCIQEIVELSDILPEELVNYPMLAELLTENTQAWIESCKHWGINRASIEILMSRMPLKQQLAFMLHNSREARGGLNQLLPALYETVFLPAQPVRDPMNPTQTCQDLLDQYFYKPQSLNELSYCIENKKNPEDIRNPRTPEDAMRMAVSCESYCQLLESSCNVQFSEQERLLLTYASMLLNSTSPPEQAAKHFRKHFSSIFPGPATEKIAKAIEQLNQAPDKTDNRLWLYQHILHTSFRMPAFARGQYPELNKGEFPMVDDLRFEEHEQLEPLRLPEELRVNRDFRSGLTALLHGMCDLNEVTGEGYLKDHRKRGHFTQRHNTKPMTKQLNLERELKFRNPANLWTAMHDQLKENAKREICNETSVRVDHTHQLDELDLPEDLNTFDLLTVTSAPVMEVLDPLTHHVEYNRLARPTHSLSHKDMELVKANPKLQQMIADEGYKRPPKDLLSDIKSPSKKY
ncbi:hypothetical protein EOPP23_07815 [Endozoicomonas sp. OPT23]|nr:hypothetical protein [Endozoicomonas sp. OPT23]